MLAVGLAAGGLAAAFLLLRPAVEQAAQAWIEREAQKLGLSATVAGVRLTPRLSLQLEEVLLEDAGRLRLRMQGVTVAPRLSLAGLLGRAARVEVSGASADLPAGLRLELRPSGWLVERQARTLRASSLQTGERLQIELSRSAGALQVQVHAAGARLSERLGVLVHGCPVASLGTADGDLAVSRDGDGAIRVTARGRSRALAVASFGSGTGGAEGCVALGAPTDAELETEVLVSPEAGRLRADTLRVVAGGAAAAGRVAIEGGTAAPRLDLALEVPRVEFARLLATAGLAPSGADLGSASLSLHVSGPLLEPQALQVEQRLDFQPPPQPPAAIERLKQPFLCRLATPDDGTVEIQVGPESPDFVPLAEVPPLFVRALLLGEDAAFYAHHGVDLAELPVALATDFARGSYARGGSTIPQQLAKNLFLSREKSLGRKLQEASLALLLDATLGKARQLEIYLNVIEWGPGIYGLRKAARHYFGREPRELTPKQMAFLVSLIPAPIKYQRSFADGVPSPFLEGLMATLLAKLESVGALGQAEYEAALAEPLDLRLEAISP